MSTATAVQPAPRSTVVGIDLVRSEWCRHGHFYRQTEHHYRLTLHAQGTYGSGFSACHTRSRSPITLLCEDWPHQPQPYVKTRSSILYKSSREPVAFGHAAIKMLGEMPKDQQQHHRCGQILQLVLGCAHASQALELGCR